MAVKIWHDDIRRPPDASWMWARTNQEAQLILLNHWPVVECSLDHDLGLHEHDPDVQDADLQQGWDQENDGQTLVQWMIHHNRVPRRVTIHSWNPPGAAAMRRLLEDYAAEGPDLVEIVVKPYVAASHRPHPTFYAAMVDIAGED